MSKALSSLCLFILLVCFGGSAWADKPKLAVLGLEVAPGAGGTVDPSTTQIAREITKELRVYTQRGTSPYMLAANSQKELTDEKLLMSCDNEAKDCMAIIGAGLAADQLLFGKVEKKADVYRVTLKLLDVKAKTQTQASDDMPVNASPAGLSHRMFVKLVGQAGGGSVLVAVQAHDGANVMVDEELKGQIAGGQLVVSGLDEGRHVVAIESPGFRRFESPVAVHEGQQARVDAVLVDRNASDTASGTHGSTGGGGGDGSHATAWKATIAAGAVVAVVGGAYAGFAYSKETKSDIMFSPMKAPAPDIGDCGNLDSNNNLMKNGQTVTVTNPSIFKHACDWHPKIFYGYAVAGVGVAGAVVGLVMLLRDHPSTEHAERASKKPKMRDLAIAPIVSPDQTGAALSFRW